MGYVGSPKGNIRSPQGNIRSPQGNLQANLFRASPQRRKRCHRRGQHLINVPYTINRLLAATATGTVIIFINVTYTLTRYVTLDG